MAGVSGRQQAVEQVLSTPEGRELVARSLAPPTGPTLVAVPPEPPEPPEIPGSDDDIVDGLLIPLWAILLAAGAGTLVWGLLLLLGR